MRISRPQMFMQIARVVAQRATCSRLNVGAVLVKDRCILSIGYNGVPSGEEHCIGNDCEGRTICHLTIHAEYNAISHCIPFGEQVGGDISVTHSPCRGCVNLLNHNKIARVFFETPFRDERPLEMLEDRVFQVLPAGYVMRWRDRQLVDVVT